MPDIAQYMLDISSEKKDLSIHYDMRDDGSMYMYKRTGIVPNKERYVVLRKEGA